MWGDWAYQLLPSDQTQRVGTMTIGLSDVDYSVPAKLLAGRNMIICDSSDTAFNFAHTISTNPTLFIHSAAQSTTQWGSLTHNGTDFVFNAGTGAANFSALDIKTTGTGTFNTLNVTGDPLWGVTGTYTIKDWTGTFGTYYPTLSSSNGYTITEGGMFLILNSWDTYSGLNIYNNAFTQSGLVQLDSDSGEMLYSSDVLGDHVFGNHLYGYQDIYAKEIYGKQLIIADKDLLGAEKITNGNFDTGTASWTLGAAWRWVDATDNVEKYQAGITTLSQTSAAMVTPLVVGEVYRLFYTISGWTAGNVVPTIAGVTLPPRGRDGDYAEIFLATSTASLVFTPSDDARFFIDAIGLKKITGGDINVVGTGTLGKLTVDTTLITTDTTNDYVGIGLATPLYRLHQEFNSAVDVTAKGSWVLSDTNPAAGARNWRMSTGYTGIGIFEFQRSTVAGGVPTATVWSVDASSNFAVNMIPYFGQFEVLSTGSYGQMTLHYTRGSVYSQFKVDSGGDLNITATGGDINFDNENLKTTGTGTFSKVLTPEIKTDTTTATDLTITTGAVKTLVLATSVYDDLQFQVAYAKVTPNNLLPSWEAFTTNTSEYAFAIDEEADTAANELPHWWKEGTVGNAHLHITTKGVPAQEQKARFTVTFAYADTDEVWVEQALTAEKTIPISTTALTNFYLDLGDLTFTNYLVGAQVKCRIKRVAKTAGGTEYAGDIFITQCGIHLEKIRMGSRNELTS